MAFMPCIINSTAAYYRQPVTTTQDGTLLSSGRHNFPRKRGLKSSAVNPVLPKRTVAGATSQPGHSADLRLEFMMFFGNSQVGICPTRWPVRGDADCSCC